MFRSRSSAGSTSASASQRRSSYRFVPVWCGVTPAVRCTVVVVRVDEWVVVSVLAHDARKLAKKRTRGIVE